MSPRRIMIIGGPGSGKSTLARQLGDALDLPVKHMDRAVHWLPGWQERPKHDKAPIVARIIAEPAWVFEGGHSETYADRLARADILIWLDSPVITRLYRVICRTFRDHGKTRPDMQDGCQESLRELPEFILFILRTRKRSTAKMRALYESAQIEKHHFTTFQDINRFTAALTAEHTPVLREQ
ncbi:ATPase AAA [Shimia sp. NS0008-38b]|uniref:AAA family ATPase n=1 Tax=Shimia sp. NS0008-38b TaxID=3127653 RepID=UPI00310A22C3